MIPIGRFRFVHEVAPKRVISTPSDKRHDPEKIKQLLARTPVIRNGYDLDLLVFLYWHPRTLLTSEQIATFVGPDMKLVAQARMPSLLPVCTLRQTKSRESSRELVPARKILIPQLLS
jgi:hypothetical protein